MQGFSGRVGPAVAGIVWGIVAGVCLAGCGRTEKRQQPPPVTPQAPVTKVAPPTPIQVKRVELGGPTWNPGWDELIERSLPPAMLSSRVPRDVERFCPRFYRMSAVNKREFWAYFFQALAAAEAGLDPKANVQHTEPEVAVPDEVTGRMVRSEGLLQLAYEDARRYGCDFNWRADRKLGLHDPARTILNPESNLECGIRILYRQIITQHKSLFSPTGYWSTLHPGNTDYLVFAKQMTDAPSACRLPSTPAAHRRKAVTAADQVASTTASGKGGTKACCSAGQH